MSTFSKSEQGRWEELHTSALLFGLSPEEQMEHDALAAKIPTERREELDRVTAALDIAWSDADATPMPEALRAKILANSTQRVPPTPRSVERVAISKRETLAWILAAVATAAALLVAFIPPSPPKKGVGPTWAERRTELMASAPDVLRVDWSPGPTPVPGATGDIVWSPQRQQGYMRFRGLSVNTPTQEQYQLWIFDKNRSDKTPVDGGVFDISSDGEVIVPIQPKLHVQDAFLFAVTIEKPGGVVVSSRERLPLLAKVE